MKKIMERQIKTADGSYGESYEVQEECQECELSEQWFDDLEDPIRDYVENMLADSVNDFENYAWDLDARDCIYFMNHTNESGIEHILYYKEAPIALYFVVDI